MRARTTAALALSIWLGSAGLPAFAQQPAPTPAPAEAGPSASISALVDQVVDLFPKLEGDVLEVNGRTVTLDIGSKDGARVGLDLTAFREGREIKHPKTGQSLGRTEQILGRVQITEVQEAFAFGQLVAGASEVKAGDRFRLSAGKIRIVFLPLSAGIREAMVEAATNEIVERLNGTGRFTVTMGDSINLVLAERGIKPEELLAGKGVKEAAERFKFDQLLVVHFKRVQSRPFMDVRFFSLPRAEAAISTAFFVPPAIRAASTAGPGFSASRGGADRPLAKPRSLLQRLLGGELEPNSYSAADASSVPLREVARFSFPVVAVDIGVMPKDKIPRMVVTDGERVYQYRIVQQKLEAEWTFNARGRGRVLSLQLADLDGDGVFEIVGNRYDAAIGLFNFIIGQNTGKPRYVADSISNFLFALDAKGEGVKQTLWSQRYDPTQFFTPGQADLVVLKGDDVSVQRGVRVPPSFRPMGAVISNIAGKDTRVLTYVDEFQRLQVASLEGEDLWRSSTQVGGGSLTVQHEITGTQRGGYHKFYKIEPTPLAIDLDGDGIDEILVPQNDVKEGLMAVTFRGPAGYRMQSIETGFEGRITGLGGYRTEDATQPTIVATVVRFSTFLKQSGDTRVLMTVPQD
jgi:hypothetical protein